MDILIATLEDLKKYRPDLCDLLYDEFLKGSYPEKPKREVKSPEEVVSDTNGVQKGDAIRWNYTKEEGIVAGFDKLGMSMKSAAKATGKLYKEAGEYVVNVEGCGHFELYVDGEKKFTHHIWRATPTRTVLKAEKGQSFHIEVRFQTVKTWGASMKINIAKELPIDYDALIAQMKDINKVIFVGGISPALEGEEMPVDIEGFKGGDRTDIELPRVQREFLRALKAAGKTIIFVNCSGSAIALQPETETCDAIVQAWYAGQEGGYAVADVLFGDYNPGGKLPVTFYKTSQQLPDYEDYSMKGRTYRYFDDPLFAFGYGLSYTSFNIGDAQLSGTPGKNDFSLAVPVTNTGKKNGTETVQLYIRDLADTEGPIKSLRAFQCVEVKAGQTVTAHLNLTPQSFEFWDTATNTMRIKPGRYELLYGNSSRASDLKSLLITVN